MPDNSKAPKALVFDLDGTLVDSHAVTFDAFNHGIVSLGGKRHTDREIMSYFGAGERVILGRILGEDKADEAYALCAAYTVENISRAPFFEGVPEMLEALKSRGVPIAIVTGRGWHSTEEILRHHGVLDRFVTVVAHDHVPESKPSPHGILLACQRLACAPAEIIYVGDSPMDMMAAHRAGARGAAALWDHMSVRERLEEAKPHFWLEKPAEVFGLLGVGAR